MIIAKSMDILEKGNYKLQAINWQWKPSEKAYKEILISCSRRAEKAEDLDWDLKYKVVKFQRW